MDAYDQIDHELNERIDELDWLYGEGRIDLAEYNAEYDKAHRDARAELKFAQEGNDG